MTGYVHEVRFVIGEAGFSVLIEGQPGSLSVLGDGPSSFAGQEHMPSGIVRLLKLAKVRVHVAADLLPDRYLACHRADFTVP